MMMLMEKNSRNITLAAAGIFAVIAIAAVVVFGVPSQREAAAQGVVKGFGSELQKVSLLDPSASSTMAEHYAQHVTPELLALWQSDPEHAPGRLTSSPWPDRIEIVQMTPQGESYVMQAAVLLMTSAEAEGENAGIIPVIIQVVPRDGKWFIAAYQEQKLTANTPAD
jgi:hypothetical protein